MEREFITTEQQWEEREQALNINYKLGNYGFKFCLYCGGVLESYRQAQNGVCNDCNDMEENFI